MCMACALHVQVTEPSLLAVFPAGDACACLAGPAEQQCRYSLFQP